MLDGNRTTMTHDGANINYAANALNQYTIAAGDPVTYNANGNLTAQNGWVYTYDAQNRITNAQMGNTQMTFAYDALNRCVKRTLNGNATYYCYANWNLIEEHTANGNLSVTYVHGANVDEMLSKSDSNGAVYYQEDALGNVTYLSDKQGNLAEQYRYDAFGTPTFLDASGNIISSSAYGNQFLFTGREWLQELGLYDYRNRIYSVELGRFQQTDPIRFVADDMNLYRYVFNNPINQIDPNGLMTILVKQFGKSIGKKFGGGDDIGGPRFEPTEMRLDKEETVYDNKGCCIYKLCFYSGLTGGYGPDGGGKLVTSSTTTDCNNSCPPTNGWAPYDFDAPPPPPWDISTGGPQSLH